MTEVFIYSLAICTIFFLFKFLEMKFVSDDEKKPLKIIIKETLVVYFASVIGIYLYSQFDITSMSSSMSSSGGGAGAGAGTGTGSKDATTMAFIDNPNF
jgi:hypothetical protein